VPTDPGRGGAEEKGAPNSCGLFRPGKRPYASGFANRLGASRRERVGAWRRGGGPSRQLLTRLHLVDLIAETPAPPDRASCTLFGLDDGLWHASTRSHLALHDKRRGGAVHCWPNPRSLPPDVVTLGGPGGRRGGSIGSRRPAAAARTLGALAGGCEAQAGPTPLITAQCQRLARASRRGGSRGEALELGGERGCDHPPPLARPRTGFFGIGWRRSGSGPRWLQAVWSASRVPPPRLGVVVGLLLATSRWRPWPAITTRPCGAGPVIAGAGRAAPGPWRGGIPHGPIPHAACRPRTFNPRRMVPEGAAVPAYDSWHQRASRRPAVQRPPHPHQVRNNVRPAVPPESDTRSARQGASGAAGRVAPPSIGDATTAARRKIQVEASNRGLRCGTKPQGASGSKATNTCSRSRSARQVRDAIVPRRTGGGFRGAPPAGYRGPGSLPSTTAALDRQEPGRRLRRGFSRLAAENGSQPRH